MKAIFGVSLKGNSFTLGAIEALHRSSSSSISCVTFGGGFRYSINPVRWGISVRFKKEDGFDGEEKGGGGGVNGFDGKAVEFWNWKRN